MESGTLLLNLSLRREGLYSWKVFAPMQYRHEIGHALAYLAPAKGRTVFIDEGRSNAV
ncbi:hypothetical protein HMPREF6123_2374 [Oribacterium sinus F0268]|uniref:Uncharacterized protein n=1 Tax=Oribacterium sinus F0268 TaxID=585501 RepID=C2L0V5_9FIRM|nr:hypothetical protein HMPREF6123_2374 [Oribacterium sinus F0268]